MRIPRVILLALLFAVAGLTACEFSDPLEGFELRFAVEDTDVDLGAGIATQVRPGEATIQSESIDNSLSNDIKGVNSITNLKLAPNMFTFTAGTSGKSSAPSGVIRGFLTLGGFPIPGTPISITVSDGVVSAVSPSTLLGPNATIDLSAYEAYLNLLPANQRPNLANYANLSIDEIRTGIAGALSGTRIPISFGLTVESSNPNDPLTGSLRINQISLSGEVTAK